MSDYKPGTAYQPNAAEVRDGAPVTADEQPAEPARGVAEPPRKGTRNISPLVWVVLAALAALVAFALFQGRGQMTTPSGGQMPTATPVEEPLMPLTDAPAQAPTADGEAGAGAVDGAIPVPPEANRG